MKLPRRRFLHLAGGAAALPALPRVASALDYPTRPVHWIVGYPAGGGSDIFARLMAQSLSERLGQPFVIENRPGAYWQKMVGDPKLSPTAARAARDRVWYYQATVTRYEKAFAHLERKRQQSSRRTLGE